LQDFALRRRLYVDMQIHWKRC